MLLCLCVMDYEHRKNKPLSWCWTFRLKIARKHFFCFHVLLARPLSVLLAFYSVQTYCMSVSHHHRFQLNYFDSSIDLCCTWLVLAGCRCIVYQDRSVCPHQLNSHWHSMCGGCLKMTWTPWCSVANIRQYAVFWTWLLKNVMSLHLNSPII